jgi:WD40 repeat protein
MSDQPTAPATAPEQTHQVAELKHAAPVLSCRFDPSGQYLFGSAYDNTIQRWHIATGKATPLAGHDSWVRALAFHPSGSHLYSGGYDGQVICWEASAEAPTPQRTLAAHDGWVRALAVSPDGKLLASSGNDRLVKLWNTADGALVDVLAGHGSHVYNVLFPPDGTRVLSGDLKGEVREWDLATSEQLRTFDASPLWKYDPGFRADIGGVRGFDLSPDGKLLACGGITEVSNAFAGIGHPLVVVFDYETGERKQSHVSAKKHQGTIWNVHFTREGFLVGGSGGHGGGHLFFWKLDQAGEFFDFALPNSCRDLDLHPDQLRLATTHDDSTLRIWQMTPKAS